MEYPIPKEVSVGIIDMLEVVNVKNHQRTLATRLFQLGIPSYAYVNNCHRGYADFGFDKEILAAALKDTMEAVE